MGLDLEPLPLAFRSVPRRLWPLHLPLRQRGEPIEDTDRELARELYLALDADSQYWWRGLRKWIGLAPWSDADEAPRPSGRRATPIQAPTLRRGK